MLAQFGAQPAFTEMWCLRSEEVLGLLSYQILSPNPSTNSPRVFPSLLGGRSLLH